MSSQNPPHHTPPLNATQFVQLLDGIELILFDMDGTLLDLAFDNRFWREHLPKAWAHQHGHAPETALAQLQPHFEAHVGQLTWYSVPFWSQTLGVDVHALKQQHRDQIALRPGTLAMLAHLHARGKRLWLVTNAHPQALALKLGQTGLGAQFEHIISSHDLGHAKEQDGFWDALKQQHPFEASQALMVDDSEPVLHAAARAGLHVLGIESPDSQLGKRRGLHHPALPCWSELMQALVPQAIDPI